MAYPRSFSLHCEAKITLLQQSCLIVKEYTLHHNHCIGEEISRHIHQQEGFLKLKKHTV